MKKKPQLIPLLNFFAETLRDPLSTNFCTKEEKHAIVRQVDPSEKSTSSLLLVC